LGVTSSGQVVEIPIGAGALDGSGTAGKLAKFTDSDTLGDSIITEDGTNIGIGTATPTFPLVVNKSGDNVKLDITNGVNANFRVQTSGAVSLIGSSTATLGFMTSSTERMRLDSSGRLGIGLTPQTANLEVKENLYVRHQNAEELTFRIDNYGTTGTDAGSSLRMFNQSGDTVVKIDSRSGTTRDTYFNQGGGFGIGTDLPTRELEVQGSGNVYIKVAASTDNDSSAIELENTQETWTIRNDDTNDDAFEIDSSTTGNIVTIEKTGNATFAGSRVFIENSTNPQLRVTDTTNTVTTKVMSDDSLGYVGTHTDHNFSILRNNSVQATFTSTGLGLGTTLPDTKLHIEGATVGYLQTIKNTTAGGEYLQMLAETGDPVFEFQSGGTGGEATLNMYRDGTQYVRISADAGVDNYFNNGSNVGIGIETPAESLHTTGNIRFGDSAPAELYTNSSELRLGVDRNNDNATSNITFYTNNDEKVRIDADGNVGIGVSPSGAKLDILGNLRVRRTLASTQYTDIESGS